MTGEHAPAERVGLALPEHPHTCSFKAEPESLDAAEQ
jgi:hypothetical protein